MMRRRDQPPTDWPRHHPARKHFPPHMVANPHNGHHREYKCQRSDMHRDHENERGNNHCAGERLPRVEAHRRPSGGRTAGVMNGVGDAEGGGCVHPAVGPVKPRIMSEKGEEDREWQIPKRIGADIGVDQRPAPVLPAPRDDPGRYAVDRRTGEAPIYLPLHLRFEPGIKAGMFDFRRPRKSAARDQIADAHD